MSMTSEESAHYEHLRYVKREDAIRQLVEAADNAQAWFSTFGYNAFGITMSDDHSDHEPILHLLRTALTAYRRTEKP